MDDAAAGKNPPSQDLTFAETLDCARGTHPVTAVVREARIGRGTWYRIQQGHIPTRLTVYKLAVALGLDREALAAKADAERDPSPPA
jgi:hypothetical protein